MSLIGRISPRARGATGFVVVLAATTGARAADRIPQAVPQPAAFVAALPSARWTGVHVGGHFGVATGNTRWIAPAPTAGGAAVSGTLDMFAMFDPFRGTGSYVAGFQAGYTWALSPRILVGVEADISPPNTIGGMARLPLGGADPRVLSDKVLLSGTARARLGYAFDDWLGYVTGGFAWSYDRLTLSQDDVDVRLLRPDVGANETALTWRLGWAAGAGLEIPVTPAWSGRLEYLATGFGRSTSSFTAGGRAIESDLLVHTVRVGLNYRIGDVAAVPGVFVSGLPAVEGARFAFHGQATFGAQVTPGFRSPYVGPNSLLPNQGRETFDSTFFLGMRLWQGAEAWINPEIDQGFGLSSTFGVAGFPSALAYKAGSSYPYARLPRYMLRQTIDLGAATETVEGTFNQFAGKQSADRVVLTVGKFSVADVFDTNRYANNPRVDFLNWALANTTTFDYAADAWAFTYGAAAEWYRGSWTVRAGVFDLPSVPNSTDLDPTFRQFQIIGEIEHRHDLFGAPGKVSVMGFLNRARLGRFDDAVALGQATGTVPDIAAVRRYTSKRGISMTAEQQITPDLGVFLRAGVSSPDLETNAFTDSDRTAVGGVSVSGRRWGRPDDVLGVAGIYNAISASRIAYLDAGGLTAIIGDGRLPAPGAEKTFETFYSFPVFAWRATLGYQLVANPAYNQDRGPVSVFSTRVHMRF